jgi:sigma-B regulation protein RsbU (phosphoserine phosphatase)
VGEVRLEPGEVVAVVTDGLTEATSPDEVELGDDRVCEVLRRQSGAGAAAVLEGLVAEVDGWVGAVGCSDDLTALVLVAR